MKFPIFRFIADINKFYKKVPEKARGRFWNDLDKLFDIYLQEIYKEIKKQEMYDFTTRDMSAPILRDIAEQVVNQTGTAWTITMKDGTKLDIVPHSAYEAAKKFESVMANSQIY